MKEQNAASVEKTSKLRERTKSKKPKFSRQESWRYKRLKKSWRRPRGIDNKMRRKIKGWPPTIGVGYRGPKASRGFHPSGYIEVLVNNAEEVKKIEPRTQAIKIAHTVGKRKRAMILGEARKRGVTVLNLKEAKEKVEEEKEPVEEEQTEEKEAKETAEEQEDKQKKTEKRKRRKRGRKNDDKS